MEHEFFYSPPDQGNVRIKLFDPELTALNFLRSEELRRSERGHGPDIALTIAEVSSVIQHTRDTLFVFEKAGFITLQDHPEFSLLEDQRLIRLTDQGRKLGDEIIEAKRREIAGVWKSSTG